MAGNYNIAIDSLENFESHSTIYLEDKQLQKMINLKENQIYHFTSESGEFNDRFELYFNPEVSNLSEDQNELAQVQIYAVGNDLHVINLDNIARKVDVYDLIGERIYSSSLQDKHTIMEMKKTSGYYIVKVYDNSNMLVEKVLLY